MKLHNVLKISLKMVFLFLALTAVLTSGCVLKQKNAKGSAYYLALEKETIESEICRLENIVSAPSEKESNTNSLFYLALLYSHYNNSFPDYEQALEKLKEFVYLNPDTNERNSVRYVMALLEEIKENNRRRDDLKEDIAELKEKNVRLIHRISELTAGDDYIRDGIEELMRENEMLKKMNQNLSLQNKNMKEIIEKLKRLDMQLEEKRKTIE
ncbi:MAG TPA: hypothetical protein PKV75_09435 [Desulfobacterales bacterium]|nr:hypothetical protein [Desulfobacterales bacterium]HQN63305.1 hypothetical protein [Flexilinea sp.]